ncbi:MAG: hypothetical protein D6731_05855 [Planctomycetota bacterium]|nr:MAG: hypothetical protein D6731_05855 [Planctomycetota bacterium]
MRAPPSLAVFALAAGCALGLVACKSGTSQPKSAVWFGPGSAPNQGNVAAAAGPGQFAAAAAMQEPRVGHTATVLPDGRVLVVGGRTADPFNDPNNITPESELYDPVADTWTQVSQLAANQGQNPNPGYMWDATNSVQTRRQEHAAVVLQTGTVLITGGCGTDAPAPLPGSAFGALKSAYLFEPATNGFVKAQDMGEARYFHLASLMTNGKAIVVGGVNSIAGNPLPANQTSVLRTAETFDPVNGWTPVTAPMNDGHTWGNIHQLGNDTLVSNGVFIDAVAPQGAQVQGATVRGIQTGMVWPGGSTNGQFAAQNGEIFNPTAAQPQFAPGPTTQREVPPSGIILSGSAALSSGDIFFAGGENLGPQRNTKDAGALFTTEILRLQSRTFDPGPDIGSSQPPVTLPSGQTAPAPPFPVTEVECEEVGFTSNVLLVGGVAPNGQSVPFAEFWDYVNNFMIGPPIQMAQARHGHRLAKLSGNRILVIGGLGVPPGGQQEAPLNSCEIWSR